MDFRLIAALLLWTCLFAIALFPVWKRGELTNRTWWKTFAVFSLTLAVALPVWRLRSLLYNGEINVDESQILAQALKYLGDPLPWRSVVGGSSGPLNTWILLWAPLFGLKLSYLSARITSLLCAFATLTGCALALREIAGSRLALLLTLPATTLLLSTLNFDFVHFSSEQFPSALCAWTVYLLARQRFFPTPTRSYLIGLITGALPFTKLQVAPAGVLLFLFGAVLLWKSTAPTRQSSFIAQTLGGLTAPALILGSVAVCGAWNDFLEFYIRWGLRYSNQGPRLSTLDFLFRGAADFGSFLTVLLAVAISALFTQALLRPRSFFLPANLALGAALLSLFGTLHYGILRAGFGFPHYLMLLLVPSTLAAGWCASQLLAEPAEDASPITRHTPLHHSLPSPELPSKPSAFKRKPNPSLTADSSSMSPALQRSHLVLGITFALALLCLFQARSIYTIYSQSQRLLASWGQETNPIADALNQLARPGDALCIWGWYPKLHVFTQLRPATRFAVANLPADPAPEQNPTLQAFLSDVQSSKPTFFVDASDEFVFPGAAPNSQPRHYSFPEFSRWIQSEYTLIGSPQTHPSRRPLLIYKKK